MTSSKRNLLIALGVSTLLGCNRSAHAPYDAGPAPEPSDASRNAAPRDAAPPNRDAGLRPDEPMTPRDSSVPSGTALIDAESGAPPAAPDASASASLDGSVAPAPANDFCDALRGAWIYGCVARGAAHCETAASKTQGALVCAAMRRAIAEGRVGYDAVAAIACLSTRNLDPVAAWELGWVPSWQCEGVFTGTLPLGAACYPHESLQDVCAEGSYCLREGTCPGECRALALLGEDCSDRACEKGSYCSIRLRCEQQLGAGTECPELEGCALPARCVDGVCRIEALFGEACTEETPCAYPNVCSGERCAATHALYERCESDRSCPEGASCAFDPPGGAERSCRPRPALGDACDTRSGCALGGVCRATSSPLVGSCESAPGGSTMPEPEPEPPPEDAGVPRSEVCVPE